MRRGKSSHVFDILDKDRDSGQDAEILVARHSVIDLARRLQRPGEISGNYRVNSAVRRFDAPNRFVDQLSAGNYTSMNTT